MADKKPNLGLSSEKVAHSKKTLAGISIGWLVNSLLGKKDTGGVVSEADKSKAKENAQKLIDRIKKI